MNPDPFKPRVLHVSTVHHPADPRIALRVIPTLAEAYDLTAMLPGVAGVAGPAHARVRWLGRAGQVWTRVLRGYPAIWREARRLRPALLHLYDPELIPMGLLLRAVLGVPVVLEVHENLHKKLDRKARLHGRLALPLFRWFDELAQRHFFLILTEHGYRDTYYGLTKPSVVVYNYPQLAFLEPFRSPYQPSAVRPFIVYIGGLSIDRAFDTMIAGLALLQKSIPDFRADFFGKCTVSEADLAVMPGYAAVRDKVVLHGYTPQHIALGAFAGATVGLALWKPVGDQPDSYPTKLFEYMALGLPVITADLPLNRAIVDKHGCGFCVTPDDPTALADRIYWLILHPDQARAMGERGRQAVEQYYKWDTEARKLLDFYAEILAEKGGTN